MGIINGLRSVFTKSSGAASKPAKAKPDNIKDMVTLADKGLSAMDNKLFSYDKVSAGKKFIKKIKREATNSNASLLAKTALKTHGDTPDPRVYALETALKIVSRGMTTPLGAALSQTGRSITNRVPFTWQKVLQGKPFIKAIIKNSDNKIEVSLAKAALRVKSGSQFKPGAYAFEAVFDRISKGVTGPVSFDLAETGLDAMKEAFLTNESVLIGRAFLEQIVDTLPENSPHAKLAAEALKTKPTNSAEVVYAKALLKIKGSETASKARKKAAEKGKSDFLLDAYNDAAEGKTENKKPRKEYILNNNDEAFVVIGGVRLEKRKS